MKNRAEVMCASKEDLLEVSVRFIYKNPFHIHLSICIWSKNQISSRSIIFKIHLSINTFTSPDTVSDDITNRSKMLFSLPKETRNLRYELLIRCKFGKNCRYQYFCGLLENLVIKCHIMLTLFTVFLKMESFLCWV